MSSIQNNPPWSDKILIKNWAAIERRVGAKWMPVALKEHRDLASAKRYLAEIMQVSGLDPAVKSQVESNIKLLEKKKKGLGFEEYGCGHYGCVMPTREKGIVIKITTDPSEAAFVAAYLSMRPSERPAGIVPYHKIFAIRTESHAKRPVFVLWRDEAQAVGAISGWIASSAREFEKDYYKKSFRKVETYIQNCLFAGRDIRKMVIKRPDAAAYMTRALDLIHDVWEYPSPVNLKGERKLAWFLNQFKQNADRMQEEPMGNYVGQALSESFDAGLLLADVHLNNIGMPAGPLADEIGMTPIITDPGHAIALDGRYAGLQIEEL